MTPADDLRWLVAVVDAGSFRGAAERNNVTAAAVSKRIKLLESRLGARLLTRTTRQLSLTEAGNLYYQRGKTLLEELNALEDCVRDSRDELRGSLRVNTSLSYAQNILVAPIMSFLQANPGIDLSLTLDDAYVDVATGEYDVVLRLGKLVDSSLIARHVAHAKVVCCASPSWLKRNREPTSPSDLESLACLIYVQRERQSTWTFEQGDIKLQVPVSSQFTCNNGDMLRDAAISGQGIALLPDFIVAKAIQDGALVPLLQDWLPHKIDVNAVYPSRDYLPQKVSAFIEHLRAALS